MVVLLNPSSQGQFKADMLRYIVQVSCLHYKHDKLSVNPISELAFTHSSVHVTDTFELLYFGYRRYCFLVSYFLFTLSVIVTPPNPANKRQSQHKIF